MISLPVGMMPVELLDARQGSLPLRELAVAWPFRLISVVYRPRVA